MRTFRKHARPTFEQMNDRVRNWFATLVFAVMVLVLSLCGVVNNMIKGNYDMALICGLAFIVGDFVLWHAYTVWSNTKKCLALCISLDQVSASYNR